MEREHRIAEAIIALTEALDPHRQGECWPDPIAWYGHRLEKQAIDTLVLADESTDPAVTEAAESLRNALERNMLIEAIERFLRCRASDGTKCAPNDADFEFARNVVNNAKGK